MAKLVLNALKCKACGDVIVSKHRHDFVRCSCGKIFVDGGLSYQRCGGDLSLIDDVSEWEDEEGNPTNGEGTCG
jgi:hypothetical protein